MVGKRVCEEVFWILYSVWEALCELDELRINLWYEMEYHTVPPDSLCSLWGKDI